MGTIAEKLTYLSGTKDAIKTAIESKGVTVETDDTFREYADRIGEIQQGGGDGVPFGYIEKAYVSISSISWGYNCQISDNSSKHSLLIPYTFIKGTRYRVTFKSTNPIDRVYAYLALAITSGNFIYSDVNSARSSYRVAYSQYSQTYEQTIEFTPTSTVDTGVTWFAMIATLTYSNIPASNRNYTILIEEV